MAGTRRFYLCALAAIGTGAAQAQTYTVLHRFTGSPDGALPYYGNLIADPAGNLYGTTPSGGGADAGVVFKLNQSGETVLYRFTGGADGGDPQAGVILGAGGNLYGTTFSGCSGASGVVFKLDAAGNETVLHSFTGPDGWGPWAGLVQDPAGNLYGTTFAGGAADFGVVFKVDSAGNETVLYNFIAEADGVNPYGSLVMDPAGNLNGTTAKGGRWGYGTVFKLDTAGVETVLHSFAGYRRNGGSQPLAGLVRDSQGNLYGTTNLGGIVSGACAIGCGWVFKLAP